MTSNSDNGSAITFSYLATILYHVQIVSYGIEQPSTLKHTARLTTITHKLHKFLSLAFVHTYFPYHKCLV